MRDYITEFILANEIRMKRTTFNGCFCIVEGDSDAKIYSQFFDYSRCKVVIAHQRDVAVKALSLLEREDFPGVLAIVDADFSVLDGIQPDTKNLFYTDTHDLETMMLKSRALEKLIVEFGTKDKCDRFTKSHGTIREVLLKAGTVIGYLRWVSITDKLSLKFEGVSFNDFIDNKHLQVEFSKLLKSVKDHSQKHELDEKKIRGRTDAIRNAKHDPWHVCCGHDLCQILTHAFRHTIGSKKAKQIHLDNIEQALRLAYEKAFFLATDLHNRLSNWQNSAHGFRLFVKGA